ncbi:hypothetical protein ACHAAC_03635 [Aeromicrobium sp. CF4.19]|uniref:hypothetical protein n=1 Tax=Aeromicrobium sp. CF4.19 TaxID=3373082 RepID=UPI003EE6F852
MAMNESSPLERATRAMRQQEQPGWVELSQSIRDAVETTVRRGVDLRAGTGPNERGSTVAVADRVLRLMLRDAINLGRSSLAGAKMQVEEGRIVRLRLDLACPYGTDMVDEAEQARAVAEATLVSTLGPDGDVPVDVHVVDVDVDVDVE